MEFDSSPQGQPVSLSVVPPEDRELATETMDRFRMLMQQSGYEIDELRMAFANMGLTTLVRSDLAPKDVLTLIRSVKEVATLMGVDTGAVPQKQVIDEESIIDAINPKIEGLLEAIERGNNAAGDEPTRAGTAATAYSEV